MAKKRKTEPYKARRRNPDAPETQLADVKWWLGETGRDASDKLWHWVDRLRGQWSTDAMSDLIHEAIYADQPITRNGYFDGYGWSGQQQDGLCILNAIKSLVDTATARLTKLRSMPVISADDAGYAEKRFAREASRVLRRKMGATEFELAAPLVIRDFCVGGTGVWKTEAIDGDAVTKRIRFYELVFDRREVQFGPPRCIAHVRPENRDEMVKRYPRYAEQINAVSLFTRMDPWMQFVYQGPQLTDMVEVAEAWTPGPDGQHIVCIRGTCVMREPWECPIPIVLPYWTPPMRGIRGTGLVEEHAKAQDWINEILSDAREAIHLASQLKVFVPRGSNVNKQHLARRNEPHTVEIDGAPGQIQYIAPDPVSKQAWQIAFQIKSEMYNISGISEWTATANKPLGQGASGKALETMNDNQSDRFANVETNWQMSRVQVGRCLIDVARHISRDADDEFEECPEEPEQVAAWIEAIDWKRVDIDNGDYKLTLEPINFITGTRGGKLEEAAEAAKAGLIPDPTMTAALFEEPDLQRMNRPILGPYHRIEMCMDGLADVKQSYMDLAPDDTMNLALAKLMAKGELEQAKADKADDAIIQRFMMFLDDIKAKETEANASPSLAGAQANNIVAQGNAATLQAGPPAPAGPPMPPGPGPGLPPGMMQ